jgi:enoyl-CoA hydratase/carnithine racemase
MSEINIRITGKAGRITLTRPKALNALTYDMCKAIHAALLDWQSDDTVALVLIDAEGDKAFCAGGDIADLYQTGLQGDYGYGRTFWRDEYRLNALLANYPKPVVSLMQGFTMGGGVGIGCHGSHRVVEAGSNVAMPECGIGLIPDVGGSHILATAPGHLGEYAGLTAARLGPDDAILLGFADHYIPRDQWDMLIADLETTGEVRHITTRATTPPEGQLRAAEPALSPLFAHDSLSDIAQALAGSDHPLAAPALKALSRVSPLAAACGREVIARLRAGGSDIRAALDLEYRFTWRAMEHGDFLEGIRAQIIDKDRSPKWRHTDLDVPKADVDRMLAPLGEYALTFDS